MSLGATTVTVLERGWDGSTRDRNNNPVISVLDDYTLEGCFLQQRNSDETLDAARDTSETTWVLFVPAGAVPDGKKIGLVDRFQVNAATENLDPDNDSGTVATFEQDGEPDHLQHIDGSVHHLELILRRVRL